MPDSRSAFASSLDELGVSVSYTDESTITAALDETVVEPAVAVPLDEPFEDVEFSLTDADVAVDPTPATLREATTGITAADVGVGDYGSVVLTLTDRGSELVSLFVERHVVLVRESDIVPEMDDAVERIAETVTRTGGSAIIATGPSATADMGALVRGAHGPETVHVIVVTSEGS